MAQQDAHWVFGYGSLIWRPGFAALSSQRATLAGMHRRLCVYSHRHRGTPQQPGLVFGLVRGGSCRGVAFEIAAEAWEQVHRYLNEREMDSGIYLEARRGIALEDGRSVSALTYVVDERHAQYAGKLDIAEQLRLVRAGVGESGANPEYVLETARHLAALGIRDRYLGDLVEALGGVDLPIVRTA